MTIIPAESLDATLLKFTGFQASKAVILSHLTYAHGIPAIDALVSTFGPNTATVTFLKLRPKGIELIVGYGLKTARWGLLAEEITSVTVLDKPEITESTNKSVVGRALLGGLLLGPLGAVIGGASGAGQKTKVIYSEDLNLDLHFTSGEEVSFTCKQSDKARFYNQAKVMFGPRLKVN